MISTSNYDSIAWRVMSRRRDFSLPPISATMRQLINEASEPHLVVCDDSDSDCDTEDARVFECECGHTERGQDADDCRYLCTIHGDCGCADCDYEDCEHCEAADCHQKDVCGTCEDKYDAEDMARRAKIAIDQTIAPIMARWKAEGSELTPVEFVLLALRQAKADVAAIAQAAKYQEAMGMD